MTISFVFLRIFLYKWEVHAICRYAWKQTNSSHFLWTNQFKATWKAEIVLYWNTIIRLMQRNGQLRLRMTMWCTQAAWTNNSCTSSKKCANSQKQNVYITECNCNSVSNINFEKLLQSITGKRRRQSFSFGLVFCVCARAKPFRIVSDILIS